MAQKENFRFRFNEHIAALLLLERKYTGTKFLFRLSFATDDTSEQFGTFRRVENEPFPFRNRPENARNGEPICHLPV